jgi:hypothetical protein
MSRIETTERTIGAVVGELRGRGQDAEKGQA